MTFADCRQSFRRFNYNDVEWKGLCLQLFTFFGIQTLKEILIFDFFVSNSKHLFKIKLKRSFKKKLSYSGHSQKTNKISEKPLFLTSWSQSYKNLIKGRLNLSSKLIINFTLHYVTLDHKLKECWSLIGIKKCNTFHDKIYLIGLIPKFGKGFYFLRKKNVLFHTSTNAPAFRGTMERVENHFWPFFFLFLIISLKRK